MKKCENCLNLISPDSFELHFLHCSRFLFLCTCSKLIKNSEKALHLSSDHFLTKCVYCDASFESYQKLLHVCPVRLVKCSHCDLDLLPQEFESHSQTCQARTSQCPQCQKFFRSSELEKHLLQNCMPSIHESFLQKNIKTVSQRATNRKKTAKKKGKKWTSVSLNVITPKVYFTTEDFDLQVAQDLLEEIINEEIATEGNEDFTRF